MRETLGDVKIKKEGERDSKDVTKHNERDMTEREVKVKWINRRERREREREREGDRRTERHRQIDRNGHTETETEKG